MLQDTPVVPVGTNKDTAVEANLSEGTGGGDRNVHIVHTMPSEVPQPNLLNERLLALPARLAASQFSTTGSELRKVSNRCKFIPEPDTPKSTQIPKPRSATS